MVQLQCSRTKAYQIMFAYFNRNTIRNEPQIFKPTSNCLVLADIHIPYHDDLALACVYDFIDQQQGKIDTVVILGDLIDNYQVSRFSKDPTRKDIKTEIKQVKQFLTDLRQRLPNTRIIYKQGNHQERLQKYIWESAPKLSNLTQNIYFEKLGLKQLNIDYIVKPFKIGKLWFLHGHQCGGGRCNPEWVTNMIFRSVYDNFIVGHWHRMQQNEYKRINGQVCFGMALGYLAKELDYAPINKWVQGFAFIEFEEDGSFKTNMKKIINGRMF